MKMFVTHRDRAAMTLLFGTASLYLGTLSACATQKPPEAPKVEAVPVSLSVPTVTPVQAGSETQESKGVTVSVVPATFKVVETPKKSCTSAPTEGGSPLLGIIKVNEGTKKQNYVVTTESTFDVAPKTIAFNISVTNHTTHVLRLQGSVLKLNVNGKQVQLSAEGTKAFLDGILTPNDAQTYTVFGPDIDPTFQAATLDFQLFDIPIDIDKAGNVTEKTNFAWTYKATLEAKTVQTQKKTEQLALDVGQAQSNGCSTVGVAAAAQ